MTRLFKFALVLCLLAHPLTGIAQTRFLGFFMEEDLDRVTIPFEVLANLIIIEVTLNDQLPLKFVLDTGVRTPILTDKYLSDIVRVSYDREVEIFSAGAQGKAVAYIANDVALSIPGIRAADQDIYVLKEDFLGLTEVLGERVHGLIGFDFFKNFVVRIDYRDKEITFYRPGTHRVSVFDEVYPISIEESKAYLQAEITYADGTQKQVKLLVDTGASHALWLDPPEDSTVTILPETVFATPVGRALSGEIEGHLGRIPSFTLQKNTFNEVLTSFPNRNEYLDIVKSTGRDGSLGSEILRRFEVTFDYPNESIYFSRNVDYGDPFQYNMSGLSIIRNVKTDLPSYLVENVVENSPASEVDIREGDEILRVNGLSREDISLNQINFLLKSREGKRIRLVIRRDGETIKKEFRLKSLI
ncbi:MAG TPA: hypothetical protein DCE41_09265 [Cytophagales bacterium]|nr:hypothetical protein [Cytophagales bacterium]HAA21252.1 hypothetical protein [Cytophagales bacterium]HAP62440.1 hypothetical protein [Cytophagales bacterium]